MMSSLAESYQRIKDMISDREIEPCPRMNTDLCLYSEFPDEEKNPISFDSCVLMRCDRCIFQVIARSLRK